MHDYLTGPDYRPLMFSLKTEKILKFIFNLFSFSSYSLKNELVWSIAADENDLLDFYVMENFAETLQIA